MVKGDRCPAQPEHDLRGHRERAAAVLHLHRQLHRRPVHRVLRKLIADTDGPVYLVVDGHPTHRSKLVKEFVASTDGQLRLFVLPAYSPQLNPDEWVWKNVNCHEALVWSEWG